MFNNTEDLDVYETRRKRLIELCAYLSGEDHEAKKRLFELEKRLLNISLPKNFTGNQSVEITYEKNFHFLCHNLAQHTPKDIKKMNVIEVYTLIEVLKNRKNKNHVQSD